MDARRSGDQSCLHRLKVQLENSWDDVRGRYIHFFLDIPVLLIICIPLGTVAVAARPTNWAWALGFGFQNCVSLAYFFITLDMLAPETFRGGNKLRTMLVSCAIYFTSQSLANSDISQVLVILMAALLLVIVLIVPFYARYGAEWRSIVCDCQKTRFLWCLLALIVPWAIGTGLTDVALVKLISIVNGLIAVALGVVCLVGDKRCGMHNRFSYSLLCAIIVGFGHIVLSNSYFVFRTLLPSSTFGSFLLTMVLIQLISGLAIDLVHKIILTMGIEESQEEMLVSVFAWQFAEVFLIDALFLDVKFDWTFPALLLYLELKNIVRDSGMLHEAMFRYFEGGSTMDEAKYMMDRYRFTLQGLVAQTISVPVIIFFVCLEWVYRDAFGSRKITTGFSDRDLGFIILQYILRLCSEILTRSLGFREDWYELRMSRLRERLVVELTEEVFDRQKSIQVRQEMEEMEEMDGKLRENEPTKSKGTSGTSSPVGLPSLSFARQILEGTQSPTAQMSLRSETNDQTPTVQATSPSSVVGAARLVSQPNYPVQSTSAADFSTRFAGLKPILPDHTSTAPIRTERALRGTVAGNGDTVEEKARTKPAQSAEPKQSTRPKERTQPAQSAEPKQSTRPKERTQPARLSTKTEIKKRYERMGLEELIRLRTKRRGTGGKKSSRAKPPSPPIHSRSFRLSKNLLPSNLKPPVEGKSPRDERDGANLSPIHNSSFSLINMVEMSDAKESGDNSDAKSPDAGAGEGGWGSWLFGGGPGRVGSISRLRRSERKLNLRDENEEDDQKMSARRLTFAKENDELRQGFKQYPTLNPENEFNEIYAQYQERRRAFFILGPLIGITTLLMWLVKRSDSRYTSG